ncbi:MAG: LPS export ABC transporter ATP-binding protein [Legionellaceae bacterium]|nr:LPS export ABC transporter ATP-binding protein [Legionellaceae bacterium]
MNHLEAKHLQKRYKTRQVVSDISISIKSGEIVGLLGPNGAGKTTAFYMMIGLIHPTKGQVFFNEKDITAFPMHERARMGVGYLPQEASVFRKLSVSDNIMAILELRNELTPEERQIKLEQLLNEFHIGHIRTSIGVSLSGGERRRVEIARALAIEPKFILLDEPFAGIDPISVVDLKHLIRHLRDKGIGVLITDHNVRETLDICGRAYIVSEGKILCEGSAENILNNTKVRDVYLGEDFEL